MAKRDFARRAAADRMRRQGSDCIADFSAPAGIGLPRNQPTKAEQRTETARLIAEFFARKSKSPPRI